MHHHRQSQYIPALLLACVCVARADPSDVEPNDSLEDAVDTGLVNEGTVTITDGTIGYVSVIGAPADCRDYYRFEVGPGASLPKLATVSAEAGHELLDLALYLVDSDGVDLAGNDDAAYPDLNPLVRTYVLIEGAYYVRLGWGSTSRQAAVPGQCPEWQGDELDPASYGAYQLTIAVQAAQPLTAELEPNDDFASATDLGGGYSHSVTGQFIGDGAAAWEDVDVYRFTLDEPAIVRAEAKVEALDSILGPILSLRAATGGTIAEGGGNLQMADARIEAAVFTPTTFVPGDYYLVVTGAGNYLPALDPSIVNPGSVGHYDLVVTITPLTDPGGFGEPNDSILQATPSSLTGPGQTSLNGLIGDGPFAATRGDVDFYEVQALPGNVLTVAVQAGGSTARASYVDPVVVVFDFLGLVLASNDNDGVSTDSYLAVEAHLPQPENPPPYGPPATLYVMVMGTGQPRPPDPLVPNPTYAEEVRTSEHLVTAADSSTGNYEISFDLATGAWHDCCQTGHGPGCSDPDIEACVCAADPDCCSVDWTSDCVWEVTDLGCGTCPLRMASDGQWQAQRLRAPPPPDQPGSRRVFAAELDFPADTIVELDPADGQVLNSFAMPEDVIVEGQGLAVLDDVLLFMGTGRFPWLYWLDPDTGDVLEYVCLWSGSGYYGDIAVLGGLIYVSDLLDRSVHELHPATLRALRTFHVGSSNRAIVSLSGPMAALAHPNRLYLADTYGGRTIQVLDPVTGAIDETVSPTIACPCDADLDGDGDVDGLDLLAFNDCADQACEGLDCGGVNISYGCNPADLDCDGDLDADDEAILDCQRNGPGLPPNPGCCPAGLPPVPVLATALGGSGSHRLYVHDWEGQSIEMRDHAGVFVRSIALDSPLAAIGGQSYLRFGDADDDDDVDLIDFILFQDCLTGPNGGPAASTCKMFDAEPDTDVDLDDFAAFQLAFNQGGQP